MQPIHQIVGRFTLEIDVHHGQVEDICSDQLLCVGQGSGWLGYCHSHLLENRLQRSGDVPTIFHH